MSKANIEVLRTAYEQANVRGVDGILELATEDLVWISDPRFPGGGTHMGKQNVRQWLSKIWIYEEISIDVEEIIDLDDRALGITRCHATPPDAPTVDWVWCHLVSFSDGLISQSQSFLDRDEALEAAGLQEPART
jgi:ketosteroid isomerase-like protein